MLEDPVCNAYFGRVRTEYAPLQFFALDEAGGSLVGEGNALPTAWDGDPATLPLGGVDAVLEQRFGDDPPTPTVLCALQIMVAPERQGEGISRMMVERMAGLARDHGFASLIAPVRPSHKHRYPLAAMERYATWRRPDGSHLDPWLRTHERLGAEILGIARASMTIPGSLADWESWTGLSFPESGPYVVPGGLVPVQIDVDADRGTYVEPNVWMRHGLE